MFNKPTIFIQKEKKTKSTKKTQKSREQVHIWQSQCQVKNPEHPE